VRWVTRRKLQHGGPSAASGVRCGRRQDEGGPHSEKPSARSGEAADAEEDDGWDFGETQGFFCKVDVVLPIQTIDTCDPTDVGCA
jgi:hypothetical protein